MLTVQIDMKPLLGHPCFQYDFFNPNLFFHEYKAIEMMLFLGCFRAGLGGCDTLYCFPSCHVLVIQEV